jgi:hypothetical protein
MGINVPRSKPQSLEDANSTELYPKKIVDQNFIFSLIKRFETQKSDEQGIIIASGAALRVYSVFKSFASISRSFNEDMTQSLSNPRSTALQTALQKLAAAFPQEKKGILNVEEVASLADSFEKFMDEDNLNGNETINSFTQTDDQSKIKKPQDELERRGFSLTSVGKASISMPDIEKHMSNLVTPSARTSNPSLSRNTGNSEPKASLDSGISGDSLIQEQRSENGNRPDANCDAVLDRLQLFGNA